MGNAPPAETIDLYAFYERMVKSAASLPDLYEAMEGWSATVVAENPILECQRGCARCCKHQVLVGEREWSIIHAWLRENLPKQQRRRIVKRVHDQMEQLGNPLKRWLGMRNKAPQAFVRAVGKGFGTEATRCPFLGDDNHCEIYPVRPFVCRAYGRAEVPSGSAMFCEVFTGRLRQQPDAWEGMKLESMRLMSPKYFDLNESRAGADGLFTITSVHILRNETGDGDIAKHAAPLSAEKTYPVVTHDDFPKSASNKAPVSTAG